MAVISLCVIENPDQIIAGIPLSVSISTNIPSSIFYTLDGSEPTLFSDIYIGPIQLPTDQTTIVLSVFATNGTDSSPVLTYFYQTTAFGSGNARLPYSGTTAPVNSTQATLNPAPFGSPPISSNQHFLGPAAAGLTVDNPACPSGPPTGFDGFGNPTGFTNGQDKGIPTKQFPIIFSTSNAEGQEGYGIGTLPPKTIIPPPPIPERSDINSIYFDPRALVILQDLTQPVDPGMPPHINRQFFTLEDVTHTREGNQMFNNASEGGSPTSSGAFVNRQFNAANNSMSYYFFDSTQNRWIVSTTPYTPTPNQYSYGAGIVPGKTSNKVYTWNAFKGSGTNYLT